MREHVLNAYYYIISQAKTQGKKVVVLVILIVYLVIVGVVSINSASPSHLNLKEQWKGIEQKVSVSQELSLSMSSDTTTTTSMSSYQPGIPLVLHYSARERVNMSTWQLHNPALQLKFYANDDMDHFVKQHFKHFRNLTWEVYENLTRIEKADLFRYLVVYVEGGFWADSDVSCELPFEQWWARYQLPVQRLQDLDFIFAIEHPTTQVFGVFYPFQILQWTFAAAPRNAILKRVLETTEQAILQIPQAVILRNPYVVLKRTGPIPFTEGIYKALDGLPDAHYEKYQVPALVDPAMVRDWSLGCVLRPHVEGRTLLGVLFPTTSFHTELVRHHYAGSWKPRMEVTPPEWGIRELIEHYAPEYINKTLF